MSRTVSRWFTHLVSFSQLSGAAEPCRDGARRRLPCPARGRRPGQRRPPRRPRMEAMSAASTICQMIHCSTMRLFFPSKSRNRTVPIGSLLFAPPPSGGERPPKERGSRSPRHPIQPLRLRTVGPFHTRVGPVIGTVATGRIHGSNAKYRKPCTREKKA